MASAEAARPDAEASDGEHTLAATSLLAPDPVLNSSVTATSTHAGTGTPPLPDTTAHAHAHAHARSHDLSAHAHARSHDPSAHARTDLSAHSRTRPHDPFADFGAANTKGGGFLLVLEFRADAAGVFRHMSRKQLLVEARSASVPLRLREGSPRPSGSVSVADAEVASDLPLMMRDVRKVDPMFAGRLEPMILVRSGSLTVSLGKTELRAIILHDRLYFIVPDGADSVLAVVRHNLSSILRGAGVQDSVHASLGPDREGGPVDRGGDEEHDFSTPVPFEFAALEAVLMTACSELQRQQESLTFKVREALHSLRRTVLGTRVVAGSRQLELVRELKQQVRELMVQARALEEALEAVLEEDEDMERMYLTRLHTAPNPSVIGKHLEHEEAELLLESYLQEIGSTLGALEVTEYQIESTEKFVSFQLDSARNRLLKVDVLATTVASIFSFGSFVGSVFGMNLQTPLWEDPKYSSGWSFNGVVVATVFVMIMCFVGLWAYFTSRFKAIDAPTPGLRP